MTLPLLAHSLLRPLSLQKGKVPTLSSLLQAQAILDGRDLPDAATLSAGSERDLLQLDLSLLAGLSRALRARREAAGALELASAELRFETDEATGKPMKVITKQVSS
jgi:DIS3-like exonuclease 1